MKLTKQQTIDLMTNGYVIVEVDYDAEGNKQKFLYFYDKSGDINHVAVAEHSKIWIDRVYLDIDGQYEVLNK